LYDYRVQGICPSGIGSFANAQFTTATPCNALYDNSTHGTPATAVLIPLNTNITGTISTGTDIDYYKFVISKVGSVTITLTTLPANYALALYSTNGTTLLKSSNKNGNTSESISYTFTTTGTYYVRVIGSSTAFNANSCYTLKVTTGTAAGNIIGSADIIGSTANVTAVAETSAAISVKLYPNPSKDKVTIYLLGSIEKRFLQVYDARGKKMFDQEIKEMFTTLSLQKVPSGVYFFRITTEKGQILYNEKLIKQ
jgi:hypothetical protein